MTAVAVIAHERKTLGGGLPELRSVLANEGVTHPIWFEISKSKHAPEAVGDALEAGADLVFLWGGDGLIQRSVDRLAGWGTDIAIVPAGSANLLARNLGIPRDIREAVRIGLHGDRRALDLGVINGERFAVMAGTGLDARMVGDVGGRLKERAAQLGYVWSAARHLRDGRMKMRIRVEGETFFEGKASCVLLANVGTVVGGVTLFDRARPDDGRLEIGVVTAASVMDWSRTLGRTVIGDADRSPFVRIARGRAFDIHLKEKAPYELDGGERKPAKRLRIGIEPKAISVCMPSHGSP